MSGELCEEGRPSNSGVTQGSDKRLHRVIFFLGPSAIPEQLHMPLHGNGKAAAAGVATETRQTMSAVVHATPRGRMLFPRVGEAHVAPSKRSGSTRPVREVTFAYSHLLPCSTREVRSILCAGGPSSWTSAVTRRVLGRHFLLRCYKAALNLALFPMKLAGA